jgi:hypothetical protein
VGFLSPLFLGGLLAAALPVYVHLLRQHKTVPVPFSSLMFFEKRTQSSVKHRRLRYLMLLTLRLLVILLLALLFANPFIRRAASASSQGSKLMVIAVDNSFSMRADGRLERARQEGLNALAGFRQGDRGQVMSFASGVTLLTQQVDSLAELQAAVKAVQPGDGRSAYGELTRTLRALSQPNGPPIEVHVISDMQKSSLPQPFSELSLPSTTKLVLHPIASGRDPNWYIEAVTAPTSVYQPKKVRIQATVASAGGPAAEIPVTLSLNGKTVDTRSVKIGANGRASVEFFLSDAAYGLNRGEVKLASRDNLAQDDVFPFAIERKEASKILFVHEARNPRGAHYYRAAIDSTPDSGFTVDVVSTDQSGNLDPRKYAVVVLSDVGRLAESFVSNLNSYVRAGGGVLITAGALTATQPRVPVVDEGIVESRYASRSGERFQAAGSVDTGHPALSRVNKFDEVKFYQTVRIEPGKARVLARLTDQTPLVLEKKIGEGRTLVFASTFDNIANDLPLHTSFVPFVEQAAIYLSGVDPAPPNYVVDSHVELRAAKDMGSAVEVLDPGGQRALSLKQAASAQALRLDREGFYEIRRANGRHELVAVHADRRESDLETIPQETLALWQSPGGESNNGNRSPGEQDVRPWSLWWYFALALLMVTLAESLFAGRYLVAEQEPAERTRKAAA